MKQSHRDLLATAGVSSLFIAALVTLAILALTGCSSCSKPPPAPDPVAAPTAPKGPRGCVEDSDCPAGEVCAANVCGAPECYADTDCGEWVCEDGHCVVGDPPAAKPAAKPVPVCDLEGLPAIAFAFDSAALDGEAERQIEDAAACLEHHRGVVVVEGHCDPRGTVEYNLALGQARASSVKRRLSQHGAGTVHTVSKGEEEPLCPEWTEICHAENRRVEFR